MELVAFIRLARWRGVNRIKRLDKIHVELECVGLDKFKWKVRLRVNVHTNNFKSCSAVSDCNTARAAK